MGKKKKFTAAPQETAWTLPFWKQALCIAICGLMAHGLLLFTDYQVWDSWINGFFTRNPKYWNHLQDLSSQYGRPMDLVFFLPFYGSENYVFLSKLVSFLTWIGSFVAILFVFPKISGIEQELCFFSALAAVAMPFYEYIGEYVFLIYVLPFFLFWIGWLFIVFGKNKGIYFIIVSRLLGFSFIFFSFSFNALLVFHLGVLFIFLLNITNFLKERSIRLLLVASIKYIDLAFLPFLFWIHKSIFTPMHGYAAKTDYNTIKTGISNYIAGYSQNISEVLNRFASILDSPTSLTAFAILAFIFLITLKKVSYVNPIATHSPRGSVSLVIIGVFLTILSAFPYIAVGKFYEGFGYNSRLGIFYCITISFVLVGAIFCVQTFLTSKRNLLAYALVACLCSYGIVESNRNYLRLSGYSAKQFSIANKIRNYISKNTGISVVHLREYYQFPKTTQWVPAVAWTYMVSTGPSLPEILVVDTRNFLPDAKTPPGKSDLQSVFPLLEFSKQDVEHFCWITSIPDTLKNVLRTGKTINMAALESGMGINGETIGLDYILKRVFEPSSIQEFFQRLTKVIVFDHGQVVEIEIN